MFSVRLGSNAQGSRWSALVSQCQVASFSTRWSELMASSLDRKKVGKYLRCFYCGRRSNLKQDGFVREWACTTCEAVNYLDLNGEITEPPVATTLEVPTKVQYAQALPRPASPSPNPNTALFCNDCLKNQHLFTFSLAQYNPNDEPRLYDREYYEFRKNLEERYPQVCSDCEAGVLERIKQAGYTAKTDHIRRLMDKTRSNRSTMSKTSWIEIVQFLGCAMWWLGLAGQVTSNVMGIFESIRPRLFATCASQFSYLESSIRDELEKSEIAVTSFAFLVRTLCTVHSVSVSYCDKFGVSILTLTKWSLILSVLSIWWNPEYRHMVRGFDSQMKGFGDWYKYQVILVMTRVLFRYLVGAEIFSSIAGSASLGAHTFMLWFISFVAIFAQRSIKTDITPLFAPTPEKLRPYVQRKERSHNSDIVMALNEISVDQQQSATANSGFDLTPRRTGLHSGPKQDRIQQYSQRTLRGGITLPGLGNYPSLADLSEVEANEYMLTGELPERQKMQIQHACHEEMEWDPEPSKVLNITRPPQSIPLFKPSQSPSSPQSSAFWYPVPPAPISPAQRLRNPPNQPRLQPRTAEAKQNFFNSMMRPAYGETQQNGSESVKDHRQEVEFAQPKFFPPPSATDNMLNGLSEIFGNVKLKAESEVGQSSVSGTTAQMAGSRKWQHAGTAFTLVAVLIAWNYTLTHSSLYIWEVELAVMIVCEAVALRSITDYTIADGSKTNTPMTNSLGAAISGLEAAMACYGILQCLNRPQDFDTSIGALLVCVMLVQEVWSVVF